MSGSVSLPVKLGLFGINTWLCAEDPATAVRVARAVEAAGWESVWTGEHYALPDPPVVDSPAHGRTPMLDPFVALTNVAAHTRTLLLGTGVTVVPWHQPLALAKRVASLDRVSGGRFQFGVGVGYLEPEFRALGVSMADRGGRTDDYLAAVRAIWSSETAAHDGRYVSFEGMQAEPRPVQQPGPPLHVGGYVTEAYRRAVTFGRGWYGFSLDLPAAERAVAALREVERAHERPDDLGPLEVSVTPDPSVVLDAATLAAYAELGVTRLIVLPPRSALADADALIAFVEGLAT